MSRYLDIPARKTRRITGGFDSLEDYIGKQVIANILEYDFNNYPFIVPDKKIIGTLLRKNEKSSKRYSRVIDGNYYINGMVYSRNPIGRYTILDEKHKRSFPKGFYSIGRDNFFLRELIFVEE